MNERRWISIPLFVLCIAGAMISMLLLDKHLFKAAGPSWFAAVCGDEPEASQPAEDVSGEAGHAARTRGGSRRDCAAVLASRWATLPPRGETDVPLAEGESARLEIPVAYLGMVYFLTLAIWFLFIGRVSPDKPQWYRLPLIFVLGGVAFSTFYLVLMFTGMDDWCPWCLASHVINFAILGGMVLLRPEKMAPGAEEPRDQGISDVDRPSALGLPPHSKGGQGGDFYPSHPSGRLVGACVLLATVTGSLLWNWYMVKVLHQQKGEVAQQLAKFEGDAQFLTTLYYNKPQVQITIREDDPQTSRDENYCKLVMFSDFQCPMCRSFAVFIDRKLKDLFNKHLRVVWKHYPLSNQCNPHVSADRHTEACRAARAAEAARLQGGNEAFWKSHDLIFEAQDRLKNLNYAAMAKELGLDPDRFMKDMESEEVGRRIAEDADQAKALGVKSTPAIFLLDRPVDPSLARVGAFWAQMAHSFNYSYDEKVYPEKLKKLAEQGKAPPPTTQHDGHEH